MKEKFLLVLLSLVFFFVGYLYAYDLPKWFPFNYEKALEEWQEKIFRDRVIYEVEAEIGDGQLSAQSEQACSGLVYRIKFDANELPMMSWFWKVTTFPQKKSEAEQAGGWVERDDYAARVYVIFPSLNFLNTRCIEYIWDENLPEGKIFSSPYSNNIKLIVAQSGRGQMGDWIFEERNIAEDYQKAFGRARVPRVGAIALMTDADNTLSTAEALYKNIKVGYVHEPEQ